MMRSWAVAVAAAAAAVVAAGGRPRPSRAGDRGKAGLAIVRRTCSTTFNTPTPFTPSRHFAVRRTTHSRKDDCFSTRLRRMDWEQEITFRLSCRRAVRRAGPFHFPDTVRQMRRLQPSRTNPYRVGYSRKTEHLYKNLDRHPRPEAGLCRKTSPESYKSCSGHSTKGGTGAGRPAYSTTIKSQIVVCPTSRKL